MERRIINFDVRAELLVAARESHPGIRSDWKFMQLFYDGGLLAVGENQATIEASGSSVRLYFVRERQYGFLTISKSVQSITDREHFSLSTSWETTDSVESVAERCGAFANAYCQRSGSAEVSSCSPVLQSIIEISVHGRGSEYCAAICVGLENGSVVITNDPTKDGFLIRFNHANWLGEVLSEVTRAHEATQLPLPEYSTAVFDVTLDSLKTVKLIHEDINPSWQYEQLLYDSGSVEVRGNNIRAEVGGATVALCFRKGGQRGFLTVFRKSIPFEDIRLIDLSTVWETDDSCAERVNSYKDVLSRRRSIGDSCDPAAQFRHAIEFTVHHDDGSVRPCICVELGGGQNILVTENDQAEGFSVEFNCADWLSGGVGSY